MNWQSVLTRITALRDMHLRSSFLTDLWRYGLCSALALALDWGLLVGLVRAGINYLPAAAASFFAGMLLAYIGSVIFVYRGRRAYPPLAEAVGFFIIGFAGLLINVLLLFGFVNLLGLGVGLAKAPTAVAVFLFNFMARRTLLFVNAQNAAMLPVETRPPAEVNY